MPIVFKHNSDRVLITLIAGYMTNAMHTAQISATDPVRIANISNARHFYRGLWKDCQKATVKKRMGNRWKFNNAEEARKIVGMLIMYRGMTRDELFKSFLSGLSQEITEWAESVDLSNSQLQAAA